MTTMTTSLIRASLLTLALALVSVSAAHAATPASHLAFRPLGTWDNYCVLHRVDDYGYNTDETITFASDNNPSGGLDAAHQMCRYTYDNTAYNDGNAAFVPQSPYADRPGIITCAWILGYDGYWRQLVSDDRFLPHVSGVGYAQIAVRDDPGSVTGEEDCGALLMGLTPQLTPCNCGGGGAGGANSPGGGLLPPTTPRVPPRKPTVHTGPVRGLERFVGPWVAHGSSAVVDPKHGTVLITQRTYTWCGPGVPLPCDSMVGNIIVDGLHVTVRILGIQGDTAQGAVIKTTSPRDLPVGTPVSVTLLSHGRLGVRAPGTALSGRYWCNTGYFTRHPQEYLQWGCGA